MISVVIPTFNSEAGLPATLTALVPAAVAGLVREVIISDGGSQDATAAITDQTGARLIVGERGRGEQLRTGAPSAPPRSGSPWTITACGLACSSVWSPCAARCLPCPMATRVC